MNKLRRSVLPFALLLLTVVPLSAQTSLSEGATFAFQGFGAVVAVGDGDVLVGEPRNLFRPGIVYVYRKGGSGGWEESAQLMSPEPALRDRFGSSLAVDGRTMLVGGDPQNEETPGLVYVLERDVMGDWSNTGQLLAAGVAAGDGFGAALHLAGDLAFVGAPNHDSTGAVYVFRRGNDGWLQAARLAPAEAAVGDGFGSTIAVAGEHVLIGAPRANGGAGAAYHFHPGADGWMELGGLTSTNADEQAAFGSAIAALGNRFFIGMPQQNNRIGAVASFVFDPGNGELVEETPLVPFDGGGRSAFGSALVATETGLWVGAPGARTVHSISVDENGWTGVTKISPDDAANAGNFGGALSINGAVAVVGIASGDNGAGNAMIYEMVDGVWTAANLLGSSQESMDPITGGRVNCDAEGRLNAWECSDVDLVSFLPVSEIGGGRGIWLNDIWGWTDSLTGHDYAIIGRIDGTSFVDITDPLHPRYMGELPKTEGSRTAAWRDIKVYRNHAYIVADGAGDHGMQVFDLTELRNVGPEPVTFTEVFHYDNIASAHNVIINEGSGYAYIVGASGGGESCGGALHVVDIREPAEPSFVRCFSDNVTGRRGTGYSHDAQCLNYTGPDTDYQGREICIGANETALSFYDVTDKDNPVAIVNVSYPNVAYAHQGWLSEDQRYFYSNDEGDEGAGTVPGTRTLVWDVSDLDDPVLANEYFATTTDTDHNLYVVGNYMYQSNYGAGMRVLDVSDPANPVEVGFFDTSPDELGCCGSWSNYPFFDSGVIAVTGFNAGVFFLRKRENLVP